MVTYPWSGTILGAARLCAPEFAGKKAQDPDAVSVFKVRAPGPGVSTFYSVMSREPEKLQELVHDVFLYGVQAGFSIGEPS